jgi:hypothetical protein
MDDVQRMHILDATKHLELKEDKSQGRIVRRIHLKATLRRLNIVIIIGLIYRCSISRVHKKEKKSRKRIVQP